MFQWKGENVTGWTVTGYNVNITITLTWESGQKNSYATEGYEPQHVCCNPCKIIQCLIIHQTPNHNWGDERFFSRKREVGLKGELFRIQSST